MNKTISHTHKKTKKLKTLQRLTESNLDAQYGLCSTFLKHTSDQLFQKEMQVMMESNLLIDTLSQNYSQSFKQNKIYLDNQSTQESAIMDLTFLQQLEPKKQKMFARRGMNNSQSGTNLSFNEILRDVQDNCSRRTYTAINNLINEKKRLEKKVSDNQNRDKASKKRIEVYQKNQEFALVLQTKNKKLEKQVQSLNQKIKELQTRKLKRNSVVETVPKFSATKTLNQVKKMFQERENALGLKEKLIGDIQKNIMKAIDQNFIEKGCQKCCTLLKKIKSSLLGYKQELERQSTQLGKITNLYKYRLIEQLS